MTEEHKEEGGRLTGIDAARLAAEPRFRDLSILPFRSAAAELHISITFSKPTSVSEGPEAAFPVAGDVLSVALGVSGCIFGE
jgi:hypothetical protein